ncbi:conserved hypothetical protein [Theileria equi strain WA]|uniref:Uncharacterized protein n=1 Tax=Theileria equi strain WA TaxID=1537102 RepID=L1LC08_THEEQ|nr:conserved hypothetical protein [Theileria equi strain WA]EKX72982.1 conserved hypothetical protein [Theileria equi strain WA]|eukprot:XP_004832434.1 conserved hypothetical protein [Theileria equi strain WA]
MSVSQSSIRSSRFFADCQSASEGFLHKSCLTQQNKSKKKKRIKITENKETLSVIRGLISCCLGNRQSTDLSNISFMGYDLGDVFEDASTVDTVSELESLPSSRKATVYLHMHAHAIPQATWAIEPSRKFKSAEIKLPEARWLLLSWASRIIRGDSVNKSLLNSLVSECTSKHKKVEFMSNTIIKTFPGLELAEEIQEMGAMDFSVAIDTMMITLNDYVGIDKNTFLFIVKKECCYGVYHIHRGNRNYTQNVLIGACKDLIIFEIQLFEKNGIYYFSRMLSFNGFV